MKTLFNLLPFAFPLIHSVLGYPSYLEWPKWCGLVAHMCVSLCYYPTKRNRVLCVWKTTKEKKREEKKIQQHYSRNQFFCSEQYKIKVFSQFNCWIVLKLWHSVHDSLENILTGGISVLSFLSLSVESIGEVQKLWYFWVVCLSWFLLYSKIDCRSWWCLCMPLTSVGDNLACTHRWL
jgi:hypothetical protein